MLRSYQQSPQMWLSAIADLRGFKVSTFDPGSQMSCQRVFMWMHSGEVRQETRAHPIFDDAPANC